MKQFFIYFKLIYVNIVENLLSIPILDINVWHHHTCIHAKLIDTEENNFLCATEQLEQQCGNRNNPIVYKYKYVDISSEHHILLLFVPSAAVWYLFC